MNFCYVRRINFRYNHTVIDKFERNDEIKCLLIHALCEIDIACPIAFSITDVPYFALRLEVNKHPDADSAAVVNRNERIC